MSIAKNFARRLGFVPAVEIKTLSDDFTKKLAVVESRIRQSARGYAAAAGSRLLGDWIMSPTTADADIRSGMLAVRTRARDLAQNNDLAKAYLRALKKNVVGSAGFSLQVKAVNFERGKPVHDKTDSDYLQREFSTWAKPETATATGQMSFRKVQELIVETVARDGEAFVRFVRGVGVNEYGLTLQLIEPDWIDEKYSLELPNGNVVIMGVELDRWRRPVAYHICERRNVLELYGPAMPMGPYRRVPASEIVHIYDRERADQTRGMSWLAQGMVGNRHLSGYIEAAVVNARASACKMGFFRDPTDASGSYEGDGVDESGNRVSEATPGAFEDIGTKEFVPYDPKYPNEQFDPFTKAMIRLIASGLGVSYQTLSGDLSETSYASGRQGLLEERETYKTVQSLVSEMFLDRVYAEWLMMSMMVGRLNLPMAKFAKFNAPKWTGRRWSWVDPLKDVQSAKEQVDAGFKSATQVVNEMGGDLEDVYQEMADEKALAKKYGLELNFGGKTAGALAPGNAPDETDDEPMPPKKKIPPQE